MATLLILHGRKGSKPKFRDRFTIDYFLIPLSISYGLYSFVDSMADLFKIGPEKEKAHNDFDTLLYIYFSSHLVCILLFFLFGLHSLIFLIFFNAHQ